MHKAPHRLLRRLRLVLVLAGLISVSATGTALASNARPAWTITSNRAPTNFTPGENSGLDSYLITVTNRGAAPSDGSTITITDELPTGLTLHGSGLTASEGLTCTGGATVTCSGTPIVPSGGVMTVEIPVDVAGGAPETVTNVATVSGGGASFASASEPTAISTSSASFGFQSVDGSFTNADGSTDTQAGSHPYEMTTSLSFTTDADNANTDTPVAAGSPKNVEVKLPPGVIGDPQAVPKCTFEELRIGINDPERGCPIDSQVGVVTLRESTALFPNTDEGTFAVYNMEPPSNEPAELAFQVANVPVLIGTSVRTGQDYGVTATLSEISAALPVTGSTLTLWGVPAEASHDVQRCPQVSLATGVCVLGSGESAREPHSAGVPPAPFLTLPSECAGPLTTTAEAESWQEPGHPAAPAQFVSHDESGGQVGIEGCNQLGFTPQISARSSTTTADSPMGLSFELSVPQSENAEGLGEADLRTATVVLPPGVSVNPSAADGLAACAEGAIGLHDASPPSCPEASKIGNVEVDTPLLAEPLRGSIYLAQQNANPFGSALAIYVTAEGSGVLVKLAGEVRSDPATGQLTTTFAENPPLPFSDFKLNLFGGPRAGLASPQECGAFTTSTSLTPWSAPASGPAATPGDAFAISSGCGSAFAPTFLAGTTNTVAGAHTPLTISFSRTDAEQGLAGLTVTLPPGLLASVAGVPLCSGADANAGTCPESSRIGSVLATSGTGPDPFTLPGTAYLTGPYKGGQFGVAVVVPAIAGPFDLGLVVVRASLRIDPNDAQVTAVSDPFPTILDVPGADGAPEGFPVRLRGVTITLDRPGFTFNPTSCSPMAIAGTLVSVRGSSAPVSSHFQVGECTSLPFKPAFTASTQAKTSRADGASLIVKVTQKAGEADIRKVDLQLPKALPSRLSTLQKACTEAQFNADPAGCPAGSVIGSATAHTPVLQAPLTGPAYLVSHGGAAFPDVEYVLQADERGGNVEIVLDGKTQIKKGITYSHFETVPDAPISSFETILPEGPHSILSTEDPGRTNLCARSLSMPTTILGQNGAPITQRTKIAVSGCRAITIRGRKLSGHRVALAFNLTRKGVVTISGTGLKRYRETLSAGVHQIKVALSKAGLTALAQHRKIDIGIALRSGARTSRSTTTLKL